MAGTRKPFNFNFEAITFKTNWTTITAIVALLIFSVTMYVDNTNKDKRIDELEVQINSFKGVLTIVDSITLKQDEILSAVLEKTTEFEKQDVLVFYKDLYFENRFRQIDGKHYFEYVPDKMDFYMKSAPSRSTPGN